MFRQYYIKNIIIYIMPFNITNSVGRYAKNISVSGSLWVATGTSGNVIVTSKSGTNWSKSSVTDFLGQSVAYGNNTWVAVGGSKIIFSTNNASTWENAASNPSVTSLKRVAYGKDASGANLWIAVNNFVPAIIKSIDGNDWSVANSVSGLTYANDVAYGKDASGVGLWVAVGGSKIVTSTNGNNWNIATVVSSFTAPVCVAYGKDASGVGLWVAGADSGTSKLAFSYSGTSWTNIQFSTTVYALAYGKDASGAGLWIAACNQSIFKSTNGINNWLNTNTTVLTSLNAYGIANGIDASGQNLWIVVGSTSNTGNAIVSSSDGTTWSRVDANGGIQYPNDVAFKV
jgi:hypothetical protein